MVMMQVRRRLHVTQHVMLVHGHRVSAVQSDGRASAVVRADDGRVPAVRVLQVAVVVRRGRRLHVRLVRVRVMLVHGPRVGRRQRGPRIAQHGRAGRGRTTRLQVVLVLHVRRLGTPRRRGVISTQVPEVQLSPGHVRGRRHGAVP